MNNRTYILTALMAAVGQAVAAYLGRANLDEYGHERDSLDAEKRRLDIEKARLDNEKLRLEIAEIGKRREGV